MFFINPLNNDFWYIDYGPKNSTPLKKSCQMLRAAIEAIKRIEVLDVFGAELHKSVMQQVVTIPRL